MAVTVNDILHINKLADAVVAAGSRGLNKTVRRIATIEKPFLDHPDYCYEVVRPGDLYVSKLYVFQGHKEKLYEEIISLPLYYGMSDADVEDVIKAVGKIASYYAK